ncbi:hypothetical protein DFR50_12561 [Roseiarcus fermentans]|uniref:Uncharacterized protein n=1 Tax=Roseiarcus fermentans TaxID=1473586 RepID=A0A366F486_9HYPH|nr:hypothetical protein [Roseiarcus fermentans]RBP08579.1 hypothetical protein DFR50_12561 [Roseiarcus fermentans]
MRLVLAIVVIVYLVGVGVALAPIVEGAWNSGTAAAFAETVGRALPEALAWPVRLARANAGA